jgi:hypothetical protein
MRIKCDYKPHGCTSVVRLEILQAHLLECEFDPKAANSHYRVSEWRTIMYEQKPNDTDSIGAAAKQIADLNTERVFFFCFTRMDRNICKTNFNYLYIFFSRIINVQARCIGQRNEPKILNYSRMACEQQLQRSVILYFVSFSI